MASYRLHYFDVRGRAEIVRMLFKLAQVEFEDIRVTESEWTRVKLGKFVDFFYRLINLFFFLCTSCRQETHLIASGSNRYMDSAKRIYVPQVETQLNLNSTNF